MADPASQMQAPMRGDTPSEKEPNPGSLIVLPSQRHTLYTYICQVVRQRERRGEG